MSIADRTWVCRLQHLAQMTEDTRQSRLFMKNPDGFLDTYRLEDTFPKLTDEQINSIKPFGEEVDLPAGQTIVRRGDRDCDFFVIIREQSRFLTPIAAIESESYPSFRSVIFWVK